MLQYTRRFSNLVLVTLLLTYFLIFIGGFVRMTGAGMGCPDWPKCFDQWYPPSDLTQLPENYQTIYLERRVLKNQRIADLFSGLGMNSIAEKITKDPKVQQTEEFNIKKSWIEYLNRVLGVIVGLFVAAVFFFSFRFYKTHRRIFILALLNAICLVLQAFIGSVVVSTNILQGFLSIHFVFAIAVILLLTYIWYLTKLILKAEKEKIKVLKKVFIWVQVSFLLILIQFAVGMEVRVAVDEIAELLGQARRADWLDSIGGIFYFHRSWSIAIIFSIVAYLFYINKFMKPYLRKLTSPIYFVLGCILTEIALGVSMYFFALPQFLQPLHTLLASMLIGATFYLIIDLQQLRKEY